MNIKKTALTYNFDGEGNTSSITVSLSGNEGADYLNANIQVTPEDLTSGQTFDNLTMKDITSIARAKLAKATAVKEQKEEQHGLSNDKDDLNVTEMLIDIRERLARVEENTSNLDSTAIKASKAYSIAKENQKDIEDLNDRSKWTQRTAITAILIPIGLFLLNKFMGG